MAVTQEKLGKLKFSFNSPRDSSDSSKSLNYSKDLLRVASPILRNLGSPVSRTKNIQSPEPSIVEEILFQCRRLNPEITQGFSTSTITSSVSQQLRKAVDSVLEAQNKVKGSNIEQYQQKIKDLTQKLDESNKKLLGSLESEKKLSLKEERLAIEEIKLLTEKKHIQNERDKMSTLKRHYLELEAVVKSLKDELKEEKSMNKEKDKRIHELFAENIDKETQLQELRNSDSISASSLQKLQKDLESQSLDLNKRREELQAREEKFKTESLSLDLQRKEIKNQLEALTEIKSKLDQENDFFENSKNELGSFKVSIELEQSKLREIRRALELEKEEVAATQYALTSHKSELLAQVEDLEQQKLQFLRAFTNEEERIFKSPQPDSDPPNKEALTYFPQLKSLVSEVTSELSYKALFVQKWFNHLQDCQVTFDSRLDELKVLNCLLQTKLTKSEIFSELEPFLSVVENFLSEIQIKQVVIDEEYQEIIGESQFNEENLQDFEEVVDNLVLKANEIQVLDEYLQELYEKVQIGTEENARVAKFLMEDRIEFEKEKVENKKEIEEASVALLEIQRKTENTLEIINKREKEVLAFHQTFDCKSPFSDDFSLGMN